MLLSSFHLLLLFIASYLLAEDDLQSTDLQRAALGRPSSRSALLRLCSSQMILTNRRLFLALLVDFFSIRHLFTWKLKKKLKKVFRPGRAFYGEELGAPGQISNEQVMSLVNACDSLSLINVKQKWLHCKTLDEPSVLTWHF